jgi:hypothetical protein
MPRSSAVPAVSFSLFRVELEIRPEPTDDERRAIEAAVEAAGLAPKRPGAYESPWRAAALREAAGSDDDEP